MRRSAALLGLFLLLSPVAAGAARLLLNELLYDPEGGDSGYEFVEIAGDSALSAGLEGLRLEFCNGADPGGWVLLWEGGPADSLSCDRPFLLGEALVEPAPDAVCELGIQNGPDALRLVRGGEVLDLLGWGSELSAELAEGWPAEDLSGRALARRPDGVDTDQNALDWFAADPTPGAWNFPSLRARLLGASLPWAPVAPGQAWPLRVRAENSGADAWPGPLAVEAGSLCAGELPAALPGHSCEAELLLPPLASGLHCLTLRLRGAEPALADSLPLVFRVGEGPLIITEVLFAPATGRSEWAELLACETVSGLHVLEDMGGGRGEVLLPVLEAGQRVLLCADAASLLDEHPSLPAERLLPCDPWLSLANSGQSLSEPDWTDGLRLLDAEGLSLDAMAYRGDWIDENGRSLERMTVHAAGGTGAWSPCPSGSTPLEGHDPRDPAAAVDWALSPQPFDPGLGPVQLLMSGRGGEARLHLFDAAGRDLQTLEGSLASGRLRLLWDGRDRGGDPLPSGAYPFLLSWDEDGAPREKKGFCLLRREDP